MCLDTRTTYTFVYEGYQHSTVDKITEEFAKELADSDPSVISWLPLRS